MRGMGYPLQARFLKTLAAVATVLVVACGGDDAPAKTGVTALSEPTAAPTATPVPTITAEPTATPIQQPTATATSAPTPIVGLGAQSRQPCPPRGIFEDCFALYSFHGSALIAKGGEVIFEGGFGLSDVESGESKTPDTVFRIGSITKQFTAAVILQLQEEGLLSITDTVDTIISDYPSGDVIEIRHLLTHTSAIPDWTFEDYEEFKEQHLTPSEMVDLFRDRPLASRPGSSFSYSNTGYLLLGLIIETVTGQPYAEVLDQRIFQPLGMVSSAYGSSDLSEPNAATGYSDQYIFEKAPFIDMSLPHAAGAIVSTVGDLYKWDVGLRSGAVLTQESLDEMLTPYLESYAYGIIVTEEDGETTHHHDGRIPGFASSKSYLVNDDVLVILLSNVGYAALERLEQKLIEMARS